MKPAEATYIVLAADEALDLQAISTMDAQMEAIRILFKQATIGDPDFALMATQDVMVAAAVLSTIAGLARAETTVTAADTSSISSRMLATAVAARLPGWSRLPSLAIGGSYGGAAASTWTSATLLQKLNVLTDMRTRAAQARKRLGDKPAAKDKAAADALDTATARYDSFFAKATTADDKGVVPIAQAARLQQLATPIQVTVGGQTIPAPLRILRVYVEKSGGSFINTKNLATTLGVDPVKVSGGLVVSYTVATKTGDVQKGGVFSCRTTLTSLRHVQDATWTAASTASPKGAVCSPTQQ